MKSCYGNMLIYVYWFCLVSSVTGYLLDNILDLSKKQNSGLNPEDIRNLSDPGWKHPNWKEICKLQDSVYVLKGRVKIPRTKSRMPIPPKCGIRALFKDEEDIVVLPNDDDPEWNQFETLEDLLEASRDDDLAMQRISQLYPELTNPHHMTQTSFSSFSAKRSLRGEGDHESLLKSIQKEMQRSRLDHDKVDSLVERVLNSPNPRKLDWAKHLLERRLNILHKGDKHIRRQFKHQSRLVNDGPKYREERIVGGSEVDEHEWPWLVAIGPRDFGQVCGGALISSRYVVTAAHCFPQKLNPCDYVVRLGEHDLSKKLEKHIDVIPSRIVIHEDFTFYTDGSPNNDIALIQLSKPVKFSRRIGAACLPDLFEFPQPGTKCTLVGWGFLGALNLPNKPHGVEIETFSTNTCREIWGSIITKGMFCAGDVNGGKGACAGDSGGPLVCQNGVGKYELIGVVSFGRDQCGEKGFLGVYTQVARYIVWMERMVKQIRKEDLYDARWWAEHNDDLDDFFGVDDDDDDALFTDLFQTLDDMHAK